MHRPAGPDSLSAQALLVLLRAADTVWDASRLFFARWNISPSQFNVLNLLRLNPDGLSQTALSRQLIVHRSNVTGLVDRLETRGLVARKEVKVDRRAYRVVLTGKGAALLEEILPEYYTAAELLWKVVPGARLVRTVSDLQSITENAQRIALSMSQAPSAVLPGTDSQNLNKSHD